MRRKSSFDEAAWRRWDPVHPPFMCGDRGGAAVTDCPKGAADRRGLAARSGRDAARKRCFAEPATQANPIKRIGPGSAPHPFVQRRVRGRLYRVSCGWD